MDGSVSTLAPLFAAAFATHNTWSTFLVGLAASIGAGISMAFAEALSDDGSLTGRGAPVVRGAVTGAMTAIGGLGHALPYLIPNFLCRHLARLRRRRGRIGGDFLDPHAAIWTRRSCKRPSRSWSAACWCLPPASSSAVRDGRLHAFSRFRVHHAAMFTLAHLSDWHLASRPRLSELAGKRGLGLDQLASQPQESASSRSPRHHHPRPESVRARPHRGNRRSGQSLAAGRIQPRPRLAANARLAARRHAGSRQSRHLCPQRPSNRRQNTGRTTCAATTATTVFRFVRRRGNVALIGLSTRGADRAVTGDRPARQSRSWRGCWKSSIRHAAVPHRAHPSSAADATVTRLRRLTDAADLRGVLADKGAELLLHGHDHSRAVVWLDGPKTKIPAVGVPSASARAPHGDENAAGYNLFRIDGEAGKWRCEMIGARARCRRHFSRGRAADAD